MRKKKRSQKSRRKLYAMLKEIQSRHRERHIVEKNFQREMMEEHWRNQKEVQRLQTELKNRFHGMGRGQRGIDWYRRHNRKSHIFIIVCNFVIWFLIFRYFGVKTVAVGFAVVIGIGGVIQIMFNLRVERSIFIPIGKLKKGVDEIAKGNYDVKIECDIPNEVSGLINSFNDMASKLKEMEHLKSAYEENRKELIANISHDLKTPITSIQGYIETMVGREELSQEMIGKYHQIIYNNAIYMNKLIDDLFLFTKLDMQKLELEIENISMKAFMSDLMEEFKFELEDRHIQFEYVDHMQNNSNVNIDRKRIQQVFRNIIGNAVKYGVEGNTEIKVKLYQKEQSAYIDVFNNGPGIPEDKLPYIFDRFYRIDYARTKNLMSTGLGLAIAKELVEAHEGRITVVSNEKEGTCFTIMILLDQ